MSGILRSWSRWTGGQVAIVVAVTASEVIPLVVVYAVLGVAVRFTTLDAVCRVLECQPGDVLRWGPEGESRPVNGAASGPG